MRNSSEEGLAMKKLLVLFLIIVVTAIMGFSLTTSASISDEVVSVELSDDINSAP